MVRALLTAARSHAQGVANLGSQRRRFVALIHVRRARERLREGEGEGEGEGGGGREADMWSEMQREIARMTEGEIQRRRFVALIRVARERRGREGGGKKDAER